MRFIRFYFVRCAACLLSINSIDLQSYAIEGSEVLENLKQHDLIYEAGFTISGTQRSKDNILLGRLKSNVNRHWRLTLDGDRAGYMMEVLDYEKPKYLPPDKPGRSQRISRMGRGTDETMQVGLRTRRWGYWGHELSGNHYEDTNLFVEPTGEVTEKGVLVNTSVFGPQDEGPVGPRQAMLWSLGRFFSKHLSEITQVDESENGRLLVSALGNKVPSIKGRWELEIEPEAAWMVRKARFYWDSKPDRINAEMRNEGTVWSGPHCIPKTAIVNHWGPIGDDNAADPQDYGYGPDRMTFEPEIEEFDEQFYSDVEQAVLHKKTPTLTIHDYRVSPPTITQPYRPE